MRTLATIGGEQLPVDADRKFYPDIAQESDSGALMRAWPFGLVFGDDLKMAKECAESVTMITSTSICSGSGVSCSCGYCLCFTRISCGGYS